MISKINIQVKNPSGTDLDTDCFYNETGKAARHLPLVIFVHGFKGFKDWGGFPYLMEQLALAGYFAVSFNFSHNGVDKEHPSEFTRLDLFAENTFSRELDELGTVISYFYDTGKYGIDKEHIALIGHSRGGGTAIIKASEDKRIKCLATLAAVSSFNRYSSGQKKKWIEKGYLESLNTRTGQLMRLNKTLLEDLEANSSRLNILNKARELEIPWLIIHGKEDLSVRFSEAEELYKAADKSKTLLSAVKNTGHTFGTVHPFAGTTPAFETVIDKLKSFLDVNLISS